MNSLQKKSIQEFLKDRTCLIVEPSTTFRHTIISVLRDFGLDESRIQTSRRYSDAIQRIKTDKPEIIVTEYVVGEHLGLALVDELSLHIEESQRLCVIVTRNSNDSAVAEAAEGQIDAYVLKPFSAGELEKRLGEAILQKVDPSKYLITIREGKSLLNGSRFGEAIEKFHSAIGMDKRPTLARYYKGHTHSRTEDFDEAISEFRLGRRLEPLHYNCLLGEFDALIAQKNYEDAHRLSSIIEENFPVTTNRLGYMISAAVYSRKFEEIAKYHEIFKNLDHRTPELSRIVSASLWAAGKHYLKANDYSTAYLLFERGAAASGLQIDFLRKVIILFLELERNDDAVKFYKKVSTRDIGSDIHAQIGFLIDRVYLTDLQLVEKGKKLMSHGQANEEIYNTVISVLVKMNKTLAAEAIVIKAAEDYPDQRDLFYGLMEAGSQSA